MPPLARRIVFRLESRWPVVLVEKERAKSKIGVRPAAIRERRDASWIMHGAERALVEARNRASKRLVVRQVERSREAAQRRSASEHAGGKDCAKRLLKLCGQIAFARLELEDLLRIWLGEGRVGLLVAGLDVADILSHVPVGELHLFLEWQLKEPMHRAPCGRDEFRVDAAVRWQREQAVLSAGGRCFFGGRCAERLR